MSRAALALALLACCLAVPATVGAHTGETTVAEGTLVLRHADDFRSGRVTTNLVLTQGSRRARILTGRLGGLRPGDRVRVRGRARGPRIAVDRVSTLGRASTRSLAAASGTRRVAVLLITFADAPSQPYTTAQASQTMFSGPKSVAAYYEEASFGSLTLSGQVSGWYAVPSSSAGCAVEQWARDADAAAAAEGIDLKSFHHVVYAFPHTSSCGWAGLAEMPGRRSWINGSFNLKVVAHELGHNLGTHHAGSLSCSSSGQRVPLAAGCSANEYGDPFDVMGSGARHAAAWRKSQLGWLGSSSAATVSASGVFTLAPQEWVAPGVQSLRIPRGSSGQYLYLEYRQPYGSHDDFAAGDPVVNGVTVRLGPDYRQRQPSYLIDTTSGTPGYADAALAVGRTLTDPVSGVTIRTLSASASGASVEVSLGGAAPATPSPPPPPPSGDVTPPGAPATPAAEARPGPSVAVSWGAASDDRGVTAYRILRDGAEVGVTTELTWTDPAPPVGRAVTYAVRAVDGAGNLGPLAAAPAVAVPAPAPPASAPAPLSPPSVSGALARGALLTARRGAWAGTGELVFSYRWQRCDSRGRRCTAIAGATRATYRVTRGDVARTLRVVVRARNPHGAASAASPVTGRVARALSRSRR